MSDGAGSQPDTSTSGVVVDAAIAFQVATLTSLTSSAAAQDAAQTLARLGPRGMATLACLLADSALDAEARQWAALALGESGDEATALGPLSAALHDVGGAPAPGYLPLTAAVALGRLGTAGAATALVAILDGPWELYHAAPINALRHIGAPAVPALLDALATGTRLQRQRAAYILGLQREPQACEPLVVALGDPDAGVRREAVGALNWLADPRAAPAMVALLEDASPEVRGAAANALGQFGGGEAIPALRRLRENDRAEYGDEGDTVSETAAWALEAIAARLAPTSDTNGGTAAETS